MSDHPREAFGHYSLAQTLDRLKLYEEARVQYRLAVDCDDPGERCSSRRNEVIRRVARETGMILADLDRAFEGVAEHRIPDGRIFADAMHWRREYYPLASLTIVKAIYDSARSGGELLSPAARWNWEWLASEREAIMKPAFTRESRDRDGDDSIDKAVLTAARTNDGLSENALALFEEAIRRNPRRLAELVESFEKLRPELERHYWLSAYADHLRDGWESVSLHVGEAYRRRRDYAAALRYFDAALRRGRGDDRALLLEARALSALGRRSEARERLAAISERSRLRPEFAYWLARAP
ncbi:MAG: tetratricopeptide repeat protein [Elusimicrobiota bacterium]